jgi:hypothetical protein
MISRNLILASAPNALNEQVHVNHIGCSMGEDKKRRMYIKRTDKGLIAYCHHCNESGFVFDTSGRISTWINPKEKEDARIIPTPVLAELSIKGKMWLTKYYCGLNPNFNGINKEPNKIALSLLNIQGEIIGIQVRNLLLDAVPKYITTYCNDSYKGEASWFYKNKKTLIITEDYLSAYRVSNDTGLSSVALLRTSVSDTTLRQIYDLNFEHIYIWLDPDQAGKEGALKAKQKLRHYFLNTTLIDILSFDKEPKECSTKELNGLLNPSSLLTK